MENRKYTIPVSPSIEDLESLSKSSFYTTSSPKRRGSDVEQSPIEFNLKEEKEVPEERKETKEEIKIENEEKKEESTNRFAAHLLKWEGTTEGSFSPTRSFSVNSEKEKEKLQLEPSLFEEALTDAKELAKAIKSDCSGLFAVFRKLEVTNHPILKSYPHLTNFFEKIDRKVLAGIKDDTSWMQLPYFKNAKKPSGELFSTRELIMDTVQSYLFKIQSIIYTYIDKETKQVPEEFEHIRQKGREKDSKNHLLSEQYKLYKERLLKLYEIYYNNKYPSPQKKFSLIKE